MSPVKKIELSVFRSPGVAAHDRRVGKVPAKNIPSWRICAAASLPSSESTCPSARPQHNKIPAKTICFLNIKSHKIVIILRCMNRIGFLIVWVLLAGWSGAQQIKPVAPDSTGKPPTDTLPLSDIDIPVRVNLRALYRILEDKVDTVYRSPGWPLSYFQPG